MHALSEEELVSLTAQVDEQLKTLATLRDGFGSVSKTARCKLPTAPVQQALIEQSTGESFEHFWQKYLRHVRQDLCLPSGLLHDQWAKWQDLNSQDVVKASYLWLGAMGIPQASIAPATIAATVFLLNVLLKVGIEAICEDFANP